MFIRRIYELHKPLNGVLITFLKGWAMFVCTPFIISSRSSCTTTIPLHLFSSRHFIDNIWSPNVSHGHIKHSRYVPLAIVMDHLDGSERWSILKARDVDLQKVQQNCCGLNDNSHRLCSPAWGPNGTRPYHHSRPNGNLLVGPISPIVILMLHLRGFLCNNAPEHYTL